MTAKQAIKVRCLDCFGHNCTDNTCPLFGLMRPQADVNRIEAIRQYCRFCMNKNPVNQCASPDCSIYQYRSEVMGNIHVDFMPLKPLIIDNRGPSLTRNEPNHICKNAGALMVHNAQFQEIPNV